MLRIRTVASAVVLALVSAFVAYAPASASVPDASVAINPQAYEGQRNTILGSLFARCAPGFEFADLVIDLSQGASATTLAGKPVTCDGQWHKQRFSTPEEAWDPGPAMVTARISVTDVETGDPGQQGVQTKEIYVRPGAKIEIPGWATLRPHGVVKLVLRARCDKPWVLADFGLSATQGEFPNQAAWSTTDTYPECDGAYRTRTFWMKASSGTFRKGWLRVDGYIHTLDPVHFDPGAGDHARREW